MTEPIRKPRDEPSPVAKTKVKRRSESADTSPDCAEAKAAHRRSE